MFFEESFQRQRPEVNIPETIIDGSSPTYSPAQVVETLTQRRS
jgi:hypothetical protein